MKIRCQCGSLIFWVQWCPKEIKAVHFSFKSKDSLGGSHIPKSAWKLQDWFKRQELGREKETEKRERETERDQGRDRERAHVFYKHVDSAAEMDGWFLGAAGAGALVRVSVEPRWLFAGRRGAAGPQLGWTPAGQLCGTAAIVEQNSFLITHLFASQFNRKYSSWIFFPPLLELEGNLKREAYFPHWTIDYLLIRQLEVPIKLTKNTEKSSRSLINRIGDCSSHICRLSLERSVRAKWLLSVILTLWLLALNYLCEFHDKVCMFRSFTLRELLKLEE